MQLPTLLALVRESAGRGGSFVELGAFDGVTDSNTFLLEKCFDWRGVLIEANPVRAKCPRGLPSQLSFDMARGQITLPIQILERCLCNRVGDC